jgi:hypothetical protein
MAWKESERRTWAQSGPNARGWASRNACLTGRLPHPRSLETHRQIPADLGVKGLRVSNLSRQQDQAWASGECCCFVQTCTSRFARRTR